MESRRASAGRGARQGGITGHWILSALLTLTCSLVAGCGSALDELALEDGLRIQDAGTPFPARQEQAISAATASTPAAPGDIEKDAADALAALPRQCLDAAGFAQFARPLLLMNCGNCHDGTDADGTELYDLRAIRAEDPASLQQSCDASLSAGDTLFSQVDPANTSSMHPYKYPSAALFADHQQALAMWLQGE